MSLAEGIGAERLFAIFTQGRLRCPQHKKYRNAGFNLLRIKKDVTILYTVIGLRGKGVNARMPLQIAPKP